MIQSNVTLFLMSVAVCLAMSCPAVAAFGLIGTMPPRLSNNEVRVGRYNNKIVALLASDRDDGVIELVDSEEDEQEATTADGMNGEEKKESAVAPFLSQGEILEESLNPDLSDPKQTRVIIYIILSLLPVLFLIPLMLGSRDFLPAIIPMEDLPPVQL